MALSAALGELACSAPADPVSAPPAPMSTVAPAASAAPTTVVTVEPLPPPLADPSPALSVHTVTHASFARRTLYTWTTADQMDELLRTSTLLRAESPRYGRSFYDRTLDARWLAGDTLAGLLRAPAYTKARSAWPAPWATLLGWPGEKPGTDLIEVTLKKDAWIAMFRTSTKVWDIRATDGAAVSKDEVLQHPERLAAVHFVHDNVAPPQTSGSPPPVLRLSLGDGREAYREYVLCNESMIESWAVGTERMTAELRANADTVEAAARHFAAHPPPPQRADRWNAHVALLVWPGLVPSTAPKELYEAAIAFPNPNYAIDPEALLKLAAQLRQMPQRASPTTRRPLTPFPGARPVPLPPPPPKVPVPPKKRAPWRDIF